jgi:hypothetical protein
VSISGITFQNCANFEGLNGIRGVGGAVSASGSIVTVSDCKFFNNTAQIGGAIGVKSGSLLVSSCVFENNMATCPNAASTTTACSAWGGAIGTEESLSVSIIGNKFSSNAVKLVLNGVTSPTSKAVGGGGCISVMHKGNVSESRVTIDGNSLERCSVQMFGFNDGSATRGIQFGNTYGGAVSLYFGLEAADSLVVQNARSAFVNNECRSSSITGSVGSGGNAYGGCISVYVGTWSVNTQNDSSDGSVTVSGMESNISGNIITNCSTQRTRTTASRSKTANVYGGGISVAVGAYSFSSREVDLGSTTVSGSRFAISNNTLTGCSATSSFSGLGSSYSSNGANVYGGGISVAVGAYSYSSGSSSVSGSTTVSNTSYAISSNTLTNCSATSSFTGSSGSSYSSNGANVYGGGISVAVGAYSYSLSGNSSVSGSTTVSNTSYSISSNTLTGCSATSSFSGTGSSNGANVYGGGISVAVGAYSYGSLSDSPSSSVSGSTTFSNTTYSISSNALTNCSATFSGTGTSNGANVYGGGISVAVGAYSYSSKYNSASSSVSGSTTVSNTSYAILSNALTSCSATSSFSGTGSSYGANVYGGGISVAVGAYSYSSGSSSVSGSTTVSNTSYAISSNTLTGCSATSSFTSLSFSSQSSYGSNVYGGGISVALGAYCYSSLTSSSSSSSNLPGSTTVSNTSYAISNNTLTSCSATSSFTGSFSSSFYDSYGSNVYGGGISVAVGAYSYSSKYNSASSNVSGSTTVSNTSYAISSNTLTSCSATTVHTRSNLLGSNVYGGGISLAVGSYSYSSSLSMSSVSGSSSSSSSVSGSTTVSNTSYAIASNTLTGCSATSSFTGTNGYSGSFIGANVYGGGISVAVGAYCYSTVSRGSSSSSSSNSHVSGSISVISTSYSISSNALTGCSATSSFSGTGSSNGANKYGGGISVAVGAYSYSSLSDSPSSVSGVTSSVSGSTTVSNTSYAISSNTLTNCSAASSLTSLSFSSQSSYSSNKANLYGGGISVAVGAYSVGGSNSVSGSTTVSNTSYAISSNTLTNCSATSSFTNAASSSGANVYGGGISVAVGAHYGSSSVSGSTTVSGSSYAILNNTLNGCSATSSFSALGSSYSSNGANVYGGGISVAVGAYSYSSGSSSVSGSTTVSSTSYAITSNTLTNCSATSSFTNAASSSGANVYGGGISVAVGAYSYGGIASSVSGSTTVSYTSYAISNNTLTGCSATSSFSGTGSIYSTRFYSTKGANVYGGGISVAVGAYSYGVVTSSVSGSTTVSYTSYAISNNTLTSCSATSSFSSLSGCSYSSNGANVYGGGISVAVGAYSYSSGLRFNRLSSSGSSVSGSTTVSYTSYAISSNTLTNCSATSSFSGTGSSNGANVYGGGISVAVGAYSGEYSYNSMNDHPSSSVSGSTTVSNTSYAISSNTLTNCSATSSFIVAGSSNGANVYGGGISVAVGAYSYSSLSGYGDSISRGIGSNSHVSGSTTVSNTSYAISSNTLTSCNAVSSVTGSRGTNVYGGSISFAVEAYSYSYSTVEFESFYEGHSNGISSVLGNTSVCGSTFSISSNMLTRCSATLSFSSGSGFGASVYGGSISVAAGAYSYSSNGGNTRKSSSNINSILSGYTEIIGSSYTISSNTLTGCNSALSVTGGGSIGANVYGGGISVAVGGHCYSSSLSLSSSSGSSSNSNVSGSTSVSNTGYTISSNTLTNCSATSSFSGTGSSNGANVYGGGISVAGGAHSYSSSLSSSSSSSSNSHVLGSATVSNTIYTISSNTLTGCSATSSFSGTGSSNGANVYGGGISMAVGAYCYSSLSGGSSSSGSNCHVSGSATVSNTGYAISSNTFTSCNSQSASGGSGFGGNVYGGGASLAVGAYTYGRSSTVLGSTMIIDTIYSISSNVFTYSSVLSQTFGTSNGASAYGGAFSVVHNSSLFPSHFSSVAQAIGASSVLRFNNCSFSESSTTISSASCASGASNAAGGAVFALVPSLAVDFIASVFSNATASTTGAASSSSTYNLGGGISIFQAGNVYTTSTNFTRCHAQGLPQSNNILVSGGGLHIQDSDSFFFQYGSIINCSVDSAFSTFLQSGGGALRTQNVPFVQISESSFRDNSDSSFSGIISVQQSRHELGMNVTMDRSLVFVKPSITPGLYISCGSTCSRSQQQRINIRFQNFNVSAYSEARAIQSDTSAIMSLPKSSVVYADRNSSLNCLFNFNNNAAILVTTTGAAFSAYLTLSCAPCARFFEIALTSRTLNLIHFQSVTNFGQPLCRATASTDLQQCPYGFAFCSTILNVSVGFWASFSADGMLSDATLCPQNYCGCRNIPDYNHSSCSLAPPFSPEFQPDLRISDNLCKGNRAGVLCGGCKPGFTQSLDGYSCISNEECENNVVWTWTVSIIGYAIYSVYIVISSLRKSDGLITSMLLYGQMSSFASFSQPMFAGSTAQSSAISEWFSQVSQFNSIAYLQSRTCYGVDMGAYELTVARSSGPAMVLLFTMAMCLSLKRATEFFLNRNIHISVSIPATFALTIVLIFSSLMTIAVQLVACVDINGDSVIFIDGTVKCHDEKWRGFVAFVVMLCIFPVALPFTLRWKRLPHNIRAAICSPFLETRFYWIAVTLLFRFLMSIASAINPSSPIAAAVIQSVLSVAMLIILTHQKPYCHAFTYYFDVFCHFFLVVQFVLACLLNLANSLSNASAVSNPLFRIERAAQASFVLRYAKSNF